MNPAKGLDKISAVPPVAVVDIGSNSVRLVVYDGLRRAPTPMFNEKVVCALGAGVARDGNLEDAAAERALAALTRFHALCVQMGVERMFVIATAAVREAANGRSFVARARKVLKTEVDVLSGKKEATLAAHGVMAAIPDADGVVGDLGGGSLELVEVTAGKLQNGITLPLGPLTISAVAGDSADAAHAHIDAQLSRASVLQKLKGRSFYAVGGAWRNMARLHMAQNHYPLSVVQGYSLERSAALSLSDFVAKLSPDTLRRIDAVSRSRAETLPLAALVMERLLKRGEAAQVVTSVFGVREGLLFGQLKKRVRDKDPLLNGCWDFARRYARSPNHELELCKWTDKLFAGARFRETGNEMRLRHAACLLADISWRANPDYRSGRALTIISQAAIVGVDHPGRVFLALTVFFRYEGLSSRHAPRELVDLMPEDWLERSRMLAGAMRLAYVLTGAITGVLPKIDLGVDGKTLYLNMPRKLADLKGEAVTKRLGQLADVMGLTAEVR